MDSPRARDLKLTRILELLAEAHNTIARGQEQLIELAADIADINDSNDNAAPRRRGSVIVPWRTYPGFRADMIAREREVQPHVKGVVAPLSLANQVGGDSVRSIERQMRKYHLNPRKDWPPSTWPEEEPQAPNFTHPLALVAAGAILSVMLDAYNDGRIDGIFHVIKQLCHGQL